MVKLWGIDFEGEISTFPKQLNKKPAYIFSTEI